MSYSQDTRQFDNGVDLFNTENYSKALKAFKKFQKKSDGVTVKYYIASCYFKMEDFNIAKEHFIEIVKTYKKDQSKGWSFFILSNFFRHRLVSIATGIKRVKVWILTFNSNNKPRTLAPFKIAI
ncbi:MAG: hypothetical protein HRT58_21490 [Crocinitomicaceae bacterium]|nr:hypothetical protein [Flavobacteriales bacterium]NQZ38248.1 hypothetical protein [Crocinitomicaceae bacterium]